MTPTKKGAHKQTHCTHHTILTYLMQDVKKYTHDEPHAGQHDTVSQAHRNHRMHKMQAMHNVSTLWTLKAHTSIHKTLECSSTKKPTNIEGQQNTT